MAQLQPAPDWITELDAIDPTYTITSFQHTLLGQLPTEVLEIVTTFLGRRELVSVARVNTKLRALAERQLYYTITLPKVRESGSDSDTDYGFEEDVCSTHLLYCTLLRRPDLAERVRNVNLKLSGQNVPIQVQSAAVFPGGSPFATQMKMQVDEAHIASALLEVLQSVETLYVTLNGNQTEMVCPWLNANDAHSTPIKSLQKLEFLSWSGSPFYWSIVKRLPSLASLHLDFPGCIEPDDSPDDSSHSLQELSLSTGSYIFDSLHSGSGALEPFFAHLTSLQSLHLEINDRVTYGIHLGQSGRVGSSAYFLAKLMPIATSLRELSIVAVDTNYPKAIWVQHIHSHTFRNFKSLESLDFPYTFLFDPWEPLTPHNLPPLGRLLPVKLKFLHIYAPRIMFLGVLNRMSRERDALPALESVGLECSDDGGDQYNMFVFENHLHPAPETLRSLNINFTIRCREGHWEKEWDDYDIAALDLAAWQATLGTSITGISILPTEDSDDGSDDEGLEDLVQMYLAKQPPKAGKFRNTSRTNAAPGQLKWSKSAWTTRLHRCMAKNDTVLQAAANTEFEELDKGIAWARWADADRKWKLKRKGVRWPITATKLNRAYLRKNRLPIPEGH